MCIRDRPGGRVAGSHCCSGRTYRGPGRAYRGAGAGGGVDVAELLEAAVLRWPGQAEPEVAAGEVGAQARRSGRSWREDPGAGGRPRRGDPPRPGALPGLTRAPEVGLARRQVFDLPPITIRVTEHELVSRRCRCGVTTTADAPTGVNAPVQYGPRIKAIMVYLYMGQYLSKHRTAVAMSELFATPVSDGTCLLYTSDAADDLLCVDLGG